MTESVPAKLVLKHFAPSVVEAAERGPLPRSIIRMLGDDISAEVFSLKDGNNPAQRQDVQTWALAYEPASVSDTVTKYVSFDSYFRVLKERKIDKAPEIAHPEFVRVIAPQGSRRREVLTSMFNLQRTSGRTLAWREGFYANSENILHDVFHDTVKNPFNNVEKGNPELVQAARGINFLLINAAAQKSRSVIYHGQAFSNDSKMVSHALEGAGYQPRDVIIYRPEEVLIDEALARYENDKGHHFSSVEDYMRTVQEQSALVRDQIPELLRRGNREADIWVDDLEGQMVHAAHISQGTRQTFNQKALGRFTQDLGITLPRGRFRNRTAQTYNPVSTQPALDFTECP